MNKLTKIRINLLIKGLKFGPLFKTNYGELETDLTELGTRLSNQEIFPVINIFTKSHLN